jgi:hypothetical protein
VAEEALIDLEAEADIPDGEWYLEVPFPDAA